MLRGAWAGCAGASPVSSCAVLLLSSSVHRSCSEVRRCRCLRRAEGVTALARNTAKTTYQGRDCTKVRVLLTLTIYTQDERLKRNDLSLEPNMALTQSSFVCCILTTRPLMVKSGRCSRILTTRPLVVKPGLHCLCLLCLGHI